MPGVPGCGFGPGTSNFEATDTSKTRPPRPDQLLDVAVHVHPLRKWAGGRLFTFTNAMRESELFVRRVIGQNAGRLTRASNASGGFAHCTPRVFLLLLRRLTPASPAGAWLSFPG